MSRPRKLRRLYELPKTDYFKPRRVRLRDIETVTISPDELMAMKLVDLDGHDQEEAAKIMNISRKTLWTELTNARKKVVDAVFNGKALEISGGAFEVKYRVMHCRNCGYEWKEPFGTSAVECPKCDSKNVVRLR